ncbi:MAG TPA: acyl-CoA dehydrogenase domain-containing protein [Nevskiaceae bacterium]
MHASVKDRRAPYPPGDNDMFWLLFFLIALCALAYRRAGITLSAWITAGVLVFFVLVTGQVVVFLLLALAWIVVWTPLLIPALRQEWLSRAAMNRLHRTLDTVSAETRAMIAGDSSEGGVHSWLLAGAPDWSELRAVPAVVLDSTQCSWLDGEVDAACAILLDDPDNAAAGDRLYIAAADDETRAATERSTSLSSPTLRSAACTRAAAALGRAAWRPCSPSHAGWLRLLREASADGHPCPWLDQAHRQLEVLAVAEAGLDPAHDLCGWASLITGGADGAIGPQLKLRLRTGLHADHRAARYAMLIECIGRGKVNGTTCIVLDGNQPGLAVAPLADGAVALSGVDLRVPLTALTHGVRGIGQGSRRLSSAIAAAHAVRAPALRFGEILPVALASGWRARIHAPQSRPATRFSGVREAIARTAADLYAADALRQWTLAELGKGEEAAGLGAIAEVKLATLAERVGARSRNLCAGEPLERLALARTHPLSLRVQSALGLYGLSSFHPFFRRLCRAALDGETAPALEDFDRAYWNHLAQLLANGVRAFLACLGASALVPASNLEPAVARALRRTDRACICLSMLVDMLLFARRDHILRDESLQATIGDAVSRLQLAKAVIWKAQNDAHPASAALTRLSVAHAIEATQNDLEVLVRHLPTPLRGLARALTNPFGRWYLRGNPHDREVATTWLCEGDATRHFRALLPAALPDAVKDLQRAMEACRSGEALAARLIKADDPHIHLDEEYIATALSAGRIDAAEAQRLRAWIHVGTQIAGASPAPVAREEAGGNAG